MNSSRRSFLKITGITLASIPLAGSFLNAPRARAADATPPLAKDSDAQPKSLGYCSDADKPTKQCGDRKNKDKKDQFCRNCQLYTKLSGEGKNEVGKCLLMPANSVHAGAWCKSWVKKPG